MASVCLKSGGDHESVGEMICAMTGEKSCASTLSLWRIEGVAAGEVAVEHPDGEV